MSQGDISDPFSPLLKSLQCFLILEAKFQLQLLSGFLATSQTSLHARLPFTLDSLHTGLLFLPSVTKVSSTAGLLHLLSPLSDHYFSRSSHSGMHLMVPTQLTGHSLTTTSCSLTMFIFWMALQCHCCLQLAFPSPERPWGGRYCFVFFTSPQPGTSTEQTLSDYQPNECMWLRTDQVPTFQCALFHLESKLNFLPGRQVVNMQKKHKSLYDYPLCHPKTWLDSPTWSSSLWKCEILWRHQSNEI